jgi:O-antigen/teichoic acid export membrane protein
VGYAEISGVTALALFNSVVLFGLLRVRSNLHDLLRGTKQVFRDAWFMGLGDFAWACLWYSPALVLGWLGLYGAEEVAWIAAPVRVVVALHTFVFLYFFNLLPNLAVELTRGTDAWRAVIVRSMRVSTWPAILLAAVGAVSAPITVPLVFGDAYVSAVLPFQIVIWAIPVAWFSGHFRFSLIAAGHQRRDFAVSVATALVTAISAAIFGSQWGSVGSAVALLIGAIANALLAVVVSHKTLGAVPLRAALVPDVRTWLNPRDSA